MNEQMAEKKRRRRVPLWLKLVAVLALLVVVIAGTVFGGFYLFAKTPLTSLPGVSAMTRNAPPRYTFSIYGVSRPEGVAVSPDFQRLYVAETQGDKVVRIYDRDGVPKGTSAPPLTVTSLRNPMGLATDATGRLYVTDRALNNISIYSAEGRYLGQMMRPDNDKTFGPLGIATDRAGNILVTEATGWKQRVLVFDAEQRLKYLFGEAGEKPGQLNYPNALVADDRGRIFVANSVNGRVDVFKADGSHVPDYIPQGGGKTQIGLPRGIAIDDQERLYVVDTVNHDVKVYDIRGERGQFMFQFGELGRGDGQVRFPGAVAVDGSGRVYVSDRENDRVQVWAY